MMRSVSHQFCGLLLFIAACCAPAAGNAAPADYEKEIRPLLDTYCFTCHGPEKPKGGVDLSQFLDVPSIQREQKLWRNALLQLNDRTMPPDSKPQPTEEQRARLIEWIHYTLTHFDPASFAKDPGRTTLRRLNRLEYNNTVRHLFDVSVRPADAFPADAGGGAGFDNNADTLFIPPILLEQYLHAADAVLEAADPQTLLIAVPQPGLSKRDAAKQILSHFAPRAFRRPVQDGELEPYLKLFDSADARGDDFLSAVKLTLKAMLVSPHFLFFIEEDRPGPDAWEVSDLELATRLSYFIWASMPDQELFDLAKSNRLHEPDVLEQQVRRMLKDPKSKALAEGFGTQWLGIRELLTVAQPDPQKFPTFTAAARYAMYDEAVLFIDSVFRDDAPLTTFIDADYAFLNKWLAKHYGLDVKVPDANVAGDDTNEGELLQRVTLNNRNRGGILGLGAVLTTTSYPMRTSPVLRGKWVLEHVLGSPPPPPPPDVPELPADEAKKDGLSFRQQLELHRQNPQCASCHNRLDPPGFGLENFDAIGRWREEVEGEKVDSTGVMPGGESFSGPADLKKVLLARKDQFLRNLVEKMLGYALGRGLEYYDQPTVQEICDALAADGDKSTRLIVEVAKSYPFRYRRNARPEEALSESEDAGSEDAGG